MLFEEWRAQARTYLQAGVSPGRERWHSSSSSLTIVPGLPFVREEAEPPSCESVLRTDFRIPPVFLSIVEEAFCYRDPSRFQLLYRCLWRLTHGERALLERLTDTDVMALSKMSRAVRRDEHRMHAFVRFRQVALGKDVLFSSWYQPAHYVLRRAAPFFARRFGGHAWVIHTPDASVRWDPVNKMLAYGPGVERGPQGNDDAAEDLWLQYYEATFNAARTNPGLLKRHMPPRYWSALPEAATIQRLIATSNATVSTMHGNNPLPAPVPDPAAGEPREEYLRRLGSALRCCAACPLAARASQAVPGQGSLESGIVLIGEQPGDEEDIKGQPFVGPAGELLNSALKELGIDRNGVYVTNAVKHFKWVPRGKRRLHQRPSPREVSACRVWLQAELSALRPRLIVCLGVSAAQALLGRVVRLADLRGKPLESSLARYVFATAHPASILRSQNREAEYKNFVDDLRAYFLEAGVMKGAVSLPSASGRAYA